jgi:sulfur-carrier protein
MENQMKITVRLIGTYRIDHFKEELFDSQLGTRVEEIIDQLQISRRAVGTVLINGVHANIEDSLNKGDTVALLPILGGG